MEIQDIVGTAQISFNGKSHFIDQHGNTFCETCANFKTLYNDHYETIANPITIDSITCKRCIKKAKKEL